MNSDSEAPRPLSPVEAIKAASRNLRGTIAQGLMDPATGAVSDEDAQLTKFHGLYLQDDRDLRKERRQQKLERAYSFMLRARLPGGVANREQYLALDRLADRYGNGTLRLTTRQSFQIHGILKGNLRPLIRGMHRVMLDSIAACGDVNRNVMCNPNYEGSELHQQVFELARGFSEHVLPRSRAYHEIWLEDELVAGGEVQDEEDPIYGKTYLPRKFKAGFAIPPSNDIDLFSQDLGFIAIAQDGRLAGFNVAVGGGLGMSHGNSDTYPRLADLVGFCTPDQVNAVGAAVITTQRDYGDRTNRKHARLKYTIEDRGLEWFKGEVENRSGMKLAPARPFVFTGTADNYGWHRGVDGRWFLVLFVQSGRIADTAGYALKKALREVAEAHGGEFRLTPNQNISLTGISDAQKPRIEEILASHGIEDGTGHSGLRLNSLACPALPTCGLALAESERAMPQFLPLLEETLAACGLRDEPISIRMTGCPNGCARPFLAEIGIVGKSPGKYNLYLGASHDGRRLNTLFESSVPMEQIPARLEPILKRFAAERQSGERFGDFCHRTVPAQTPISQA